MLYVPSMAVIAHHFSPSRRSLAMTLVASGSSLGAVVHPIMLNNLLHRVEGVQGFGGAVRASAGLVCGLLGVACGLMRTRRKGKGGQGVGLGRVVRNCWGDSAFMFCTLG